MTTPARIHQLRLRHTLDHIDTIARRTDLRTVDRRRVALTLTRITWLHRHLPAALATLHDAQPGYPSSSDGPRSRGGHSDRTATLATTTRPDAARKALDALTTHLDDLRTHLRHAATTQPTDDALDAIRAAWLAAAEAERITRTWQAPTAKWRTALADEAAAEFTGHNQCTAHHRLGIHVDTRRPNGRLCRTCESIARDLGLHDPPTWIVERMVRYGKLDPRWIEEERRLGKRRRKAKTRR